MNGNPAAPNLRPAAGGSKVDLRRAPRRAVRFDTLADALAEAESLAVAEREGRLRAEGNWTLGQAFAHVAWWAEEAFDGYAFPWYLRVYFALVGPLVKRSALSGKASPGITLPGVSGGSYGTEPQATDEALPRLRRAFERLSNESPDRRDVAFGRLTHEQWQTLHLRHAEHHLAYFHVRPVVGK